MKRKGMIVALLALFILGFWMKLYGLTPLESPQRRILVHLEGEVIKPGLYEMDENMRLGDLIDMAGGLTGKAQGVNLAKKLLDGEKIVIEKVWEESEEEEEAQSRPSSLHAMTREEWMEIPGVGEVTAKAILEYLKSHPGAQFDDLIEVKGIGDKKLEALRQHLGNP